MLLVRIVLTDDLVFYLSLVSILKQARRQTVFSSLVGDLKSFVLYSLLLLFYEI